MVGPAPGRWSSFAAVGSGAPTFTTIAKRTGLSASSLDRALKLLVAKHAIVAEQPISAVTKTRDTRYRIADSYLAFWLRFVERNMPQLDRGRSKFVVDDVLRQWPDYRGKAIEPIVRESVARLMPIGDHNAHSIGSFWSRDGGTEVDIVGIAGAGKGRRVSLVGSIKWRHQRPFSGADASALASQASLVASTYASTVLVAVSCSGFDVRDIPITLGPAELLEAWSSSVL